MYVKAALSEEQKKALNRVSVSYLRWKAARSVFIDDLRAALKVKCNNSDIARAVGISETSIRRFRKDAERKSA